MTHGRTLPLSVCVIGLAAAAYVPPVQAKPEGLDGYQVLRVTVENEAQLETLTALDEASTEFEIWSEVAGIGVVEVRVSPAQWLALEATGLAFEVQVKDLQRLLDELYATAETRAFFDTYRSYDEHVTFLNNLVAAYPGLAEMVDIGTSVQGRTLWAIRITGPGTDKPGLLYHGAQHGNEIMGTCVVSYLAEYILTHYGTDPDIQWLVDNVEWFLMPIMNPDGYEAGTRYNANGEDLNRNWGGPGAYPDPFSEPETAAVRDFLIDHANVRVHVDFHTHGWMILWPYGYTPELPDDNPTFEVLGDEMAERIYAVRGSDYYLRGPVYSTIYPVLGGSVDYSYGVLNRWAFAYELGYSHTMPTSEILPTCQDITPAMLFLSGWISDCNENGVLDMEEIAAGTASDANDNGVPDVCEALAPPAAASPDFDKPRYLSFVPRSLDGPSALRVTLVDLPGLHAAANGQVTWVGPPQAFCENAGQAEPPPEGCGPAPGQPSLTLTTATLQCDPHYMDWDAYGTIHVYHEYVVPEGTYWVETVVQGEGGELSSPPLELDTSRWGDLVSNCTTTPCGAPDGQVGVSTDVTAVLDKFKNLHGAPSKARADMEPGMPDGLVNISDVTYVLEAFRGFAYPFVPGPPPCAR
jgi:murein tripeptide amidase MpaA